MQEVNFPPLREVTREFVSTEQAAFYVDRKPKTLRDKWAGDGKGPIAPRRVGGRLHWRIADIRKLLGVEGA